MEPQKINTDHYCICFNPRIDRLSWLWSSEFHQDPWSGTFRLFDFISNSVLMPIVAILTCICVGHFVGAKVISDEVELNAPFKMKKFYTIMLKWIAPVFLVLVLAFAVSEAMGWIRV